MKKKFFAVFFALLVLCTAVVPVFADEADDWDFSEEYPTAEPTGVTINVYNWGEYISNGTEGSLDVNAEFTRRTGIEVSYTTFDSNESLYSKLAAGFQQYPEFRVHRRAVPKPRLRPRKQILRAIHMGHRRPVL